MEQFLLTGRQEKQDASSSVLLRHRAPGHESLFFLLVLSAYIFFNRFTCFVFNGDNIPPVVCVSFYGIRRRVFGNPRLLSITVAVRIGEN